eukprot:1193580-Prorocentrum_minimum.AAC.2
MVDEKARTHKSSFGCITLCTRPRTTELGKGAPPNSEKRLSLLDRAVLDFRPPGFRGPKPLDRAKIIAIRYLVALLFPIQSYHLKLDGALIFFGGNTTGPGRRTTARHTG